MEITEPNVGWTEALGSEADSPPISSGDTFFSGGNPYTVIALDNGVKAQFEQWVRMGAKQAIADVEVTMGGEEADRMRTSYIRDFSSREYNYDGGACAHARSKPHGIAYLLYLLMRPIPSQSKITQEEVLSILQASPKECILAISWAVGKNSQSSAKNGKLTRTLNG